MSKELQMNWELREKVQHGDVMLPIKVHHPVLGAQQPLLLPHWHPQMEISYIREGSAVYNIGLTEYRVHAGDVTIIPPRCFHSGRAIEGVESRNITLVFDLAMITAGSVDACSSKYILPLESGQTQVVSQIKDARKNCPELVELICSVDRLCAEAAEGYELLVKAEILRLICILFVTGTIQRDENASGSADSNKLKEVIQYINANYTHALYVEEIAQTVNYSPSYLSRFFKRVTHMTLMEYINRLRVRHAAELLLSTQLPVTEVAMEVGMSNVSYFIRQFKNSYDKTPLQYRAEFAGQAAAKR